MGQIYESARRRIGFTEGVAAELADGQMWTFPAIRVRLSARATEPDGGRHTVRLGYAVGGAALPRYEDWRAILTGAKPAANDEYWDARMDAAGTLLRLNYDLSDDDVAELLCWDDDDPASTALWDGIDAAVLGRAPKPTPAT